HIMTQAGEELAVAFHLSVVASRALETWRIFATERRDLRDKTAIRAWKNSFVVLCQRKRAEEEQVCRMGQAVLMLGIAR
ncbi:MAG: hypothetical protein EZS28_054990, partial [Streblomastix strix]